MTWLAIDIGENCLRAADGAGFAQVRSYTPRREPEHLAQELRSLIAESPPSDHLVAVLSGASADCYTEKAEAVGVMIDALVEAASGSHARVYLANGKIVAPAVAARDPLLATGAGWHALARLAGSVSRRQSALLLEVGSTRCNVIPLVDGRPVAVGQTCTQRAMSGEMVPTGIEYSPICALADSVPFREGKCLVTHNRAATTRDVYLILGNLAEDPANMATADGRPSTKAGARERLARTLSADRLEFNHRDAALMAERIARRQRDMIARQVERVVNRLPDAPDTIVIAGCGEFLARTVVQFLSLKGEVVSMALRWGREASQCAAAHATATLAAAPSQEA